MLSRCLAHPLTRGLDIDSPATTTLRRQIIRRKGYLQRIYQEWYTDIVSALPAGPGHVLELGSGAGFLKDFIPDLITSDVFPVPDVALVADAHALPFSDATLKAVVMTNVFHHLSDPRRFLREAARCVRRRGVVVMVEPWNTPWSRFVYSRFHHEPFMPAAAKWGFDCAGPLSAANGALAWIVFERDRRRFEAEFPEWRIQSVAPGMPFRYLLSGGVSLRGFMPGCSFPFWRWLEKGLQPWMHRWAMFARIVLVRSDVAQQPVPKPESTC